ncbi:alpha/beta fold hydrolase [Nonomuraea typhae]|uniref:alpha/beta fold hydrolase n=1 Tax=Nonomuraea typhae TaxID=2603600 RepID=UPI0012F7655C|nr:alpha/beta hydrolase [Nonomuraea typhae]
MEHVTSADGTVIAFDRIGDGPALIVLGGALCSRATTRPHAAALAAYFQVINADRRGKGDSGDTPPYAVEREIEDVAALVAVAGGTAALYGHSSGAGLALEAAASGIPLTGLVLHEPPYAPAPDPESAAHTARITELLAQGRREEAVDLHMSGSGRPDEAVAGMHAEPWWPEAVALAHTLLYDYACLGDDLVPTASAARIRVPTLVIGGGDSPEWMVEVGLRVAEAVPRGRHVVLKGQGHVAAPEVLAPVVAEFLRTT